MACLGVLVAPLEEPGVDVPLMFQISTKKSCLIPFLEKMDVQQTNLICAVTKGRTPIVSLWAEARLSLLQARWEAGKSLAGIS